MSMKKTNPKQRYGAYMALMLLLVLGIIVAVNVLFSHLGLKVDLTGGDLYTLTDETTEILDSLTDDVTIYGIYSEGTETTDTNARVVKLAQAYASASDRISFELVDLTEQPTFFSRFQTVGSTGQVTGLSADDVSNGSLIVVNQSTGRYKVIAVGAMYDVETNYQTYTQTLTGFKGENSITSALEYVCLDQAPVVYQLTGHGETSLDSEVIQTLSYANFDVETLNLLTAGGAATDDATADGAATDDATADWAAADEAVSLSADAYTILLINNPTSDLLSSEYETLSAYLAAGGRLLYMAQGDTPSLPNFEELLAEYGLSYETGIVVETNQNAYYLSPLFMLVNLSETDQVTAAMSADSNDTVVMSLPAIVKTGDSAESADSADSTDSADSADSADSSVDSATAAATVYSVLVTTSDGAILKGEENALSIYEEGDTQGPFDLAVSAEKATDGGSTKIVLLGCSGFISDDGSHVVTTGNIELVARICSWLRATEDEDDTVYIPSKSLDYASITTTQSDFLTVGLVFMVLIPAVIFLTGIAVWMRRRHL